MEGITLRSRVTSGVRALTKQLAWRGIDALGKALYPDTDVPSDHWVRIVLNEAVNQHIGGLNPKGLRAAEISGANHSSKPWLSFDSLNFPDFDLCAPLNPPRQYDVVICEQVLEHVVDPWAAVVNLRKLTKPGGHVVVSTPFLIRIHEIPIYAMNDYWRFTPRGLQTLLEGAELEVDQIGSWGNRPCVVGNLSRWAAYRPWHPLRNEPDVPVQVWAFAHRAAESAP